MFIQVLHSWKQNIFLFFFIIVVIFLIKTRIDEHCDADSDQKIECLVTVKLSLTWNVKLWNGGIKADDKMEKECRFLCWNKHLISSFSGFEHNLGGPA